MNYNNEIDNLEKFYGLSKTDLLTVLISTVLIAVGAWNLINFQENLESIENLKAIAKIKKITDNPQRRISGTLSWGQVKNRDEIYKGDEILTDENSQAEVEFINNTKLTIPANSLVKIDVDDDTFNIDVIKGIVDLDVKKANQKIVLKTKTKEYVINTKKQTKLSIKSDGDDLDIKSKKGAINVTKRVKKQVKLKAKPLPVEIKPESLDIYAPTLAQSYSPNETSSFTLELGPIKGIKGISGSLTGLDFNREFKINKRNTSFPLPPSGEYTISLTATDSQGNTINKSSQFTVKDYRAPRFVDETFPENIKLKENEKLNIDWDGLNTLEYILELKRSDKANQIKTTGSQISLTPKRSGTYQVRVKVNAENAPWSNYRTMNIEFDRVINISDINNPNIFNLHETDGLVRFNFENNSGKSVIVNVYSDSEKSNLVFTKETEENTMTWRPKYIGNYFWQVEVPMANSQAQMTELQMVTVRNLIAKIPNSSPSTREVNSQKPKINLKWQQTYKRDKYLLNIYSPNQKLLASKNVTGSSASITFPTIGRFLWSIAPRENKEFFDETNLIPLTLKLPEKPMTPSVPAKQVIRYKGIQKREAYRIKFDPIANAKRYEIEVYSDAQLQNRLVKARSRKNFVYWVSKRDGQFYFRMRYEDKWGRKSDFSNVGQIVFPISPLVR